MNLIFSPKWFLIMLMTVSVLLTGCDDGSGGSDKDDDVVIPPPENLIGTIALDNGESAIMDIQFEDIAEGARATTVSVTGTIRYMGDSYIVGGLYDYSTGALDLFAKNTTTGLKFIFSGTYTEKDGFEGSVTLYAANETTILAEGSASGIAATDEEKSTIKIYKGTFGGDAWGSWNGTVTEDSFYGTYALGTDFHSDDYAGSGSFIFNRSGSTLTPASSDTGLPSGTGTLSGTIAGGAWVYQGYTGSWSGVQVDSNYDAPTASKTSDIEYLANLSLQALDNIVMMAGRNQAAGNSQPGGITYDPQPNPSPRIEVTLNMSGYKDPQTGLTMTGNIFMIVDDYTDAESDGEYYIDSVVSDYGAATIDDGTSDDGITIEYEGGGASSKLFVNVGVDGSTGNLVAGSNDAGERIWELDGVSVIDYVEDYF